MADRATELQSTVNVALAQKTQDEAHGKLGQSAVFKNIGKMDFPSGHKFKAG